MFSFAVVLYFLRSVFSLLCVFFVLCFLFCFFCSAFFVLCFLCSVFSSFCVLIEISFSLVGLLLLLLFCLCSIFVLFFFCFFCFCFLFCVLIKISPLSLLGWLSPSVWPIPSGKSARLFENGNQWRVVLEFFLSHSKSNNNNNQQQQQQQQPLHQQWQQEQQLPPFLKQKSEISTYVEAVQLLKHLCLWQKLCVFNSESFSYCKKWYW